MKNEYELLEELNNRLNEMAFSRDEIDFKYISRSDSLGVHMLSCVIFQNDLGCLTHWVKEIETIINTLNKYVWSKHKEKISETEDSLFNSFLNTNHPYDDIEDCVNQVCKKENIQIVLDDENKQKVIDYYTQLKNLILNKFLNANYKEWIELASEISSLLNSFSKINYN